MLESLSYRKESNYIVVDNQLMQNINLIIEKEVGNYAITPDDGVSNILYAAIRLVYNLA